MFNLEQAIMICDLGDEDINNVMQAEVEHIYSSGTLEVYIEKENYDIMKKKDLEMDLVAVQTETTIDLSIAVTVLGYIKPNGNLYFNDLAERNIVKTKLEG